MMKEVIEGLRLSPQQKHLWSLQPHDRAQTYRAQVAVRIDGRLDVACLIAAVDQVVQRHEILRTTFCCLPGMTIPLQIINESGAPVVTVDHFDELGADEEVENLSDEMRRRAFDLKCGPVTQVSLAKISPARNFLLIAAPAMNADAAGLRNLVQEIRRQYLSVLNDESVEGEPIQYADSAEWHNDLLEDPERAEGRAYWREQDFSAAALLQLPYAVQRAEATEFTPDFITTRFEHMAALDKLAQQHNSSASFVLLACWQVLLWRLTAQPQIVVGCAVDGRAHEELKPALGLFQRYLPARSDLHEDLRFSELMKQLGRTVREGREYQEYFTWDETGDAGDSGAASSAGYFPICFEYVEPAESYEAGGVKFNVVQEYACTERYEVKLSCVRGGDGVRVELHYDAGRYEQADMERLGAQYQRLVASVLCNEQEKVSELEVVSEREREQQLTQWNETAVAYEGTATSIVELFEQRVAATPEAVAVVCGAEQLTYAELNERANQLGHYLRRMGVGPEVRVGLCVERSVGMVVGVLGILKAGGAYVPLDASYPAERLRLMLVDSGATVLVRQQSVGAELAGTELAGTAVTEVCLEEQWHEVEQESVANVAVRVAAENLAYVIYTSGSTGRPKGVGVTQGNLLHTTQAREVYYGGGPECFLLLSSIAFDSSVAGLFWTLSSGGRLVVPEEGMQREARGLVQLIAQQEVTHLLSLPSLYESLLGAVAETGRPAGEAASEAKGELQSLRAVIVAGEACGAGLVQRHQEVAGQALLYNEYGPTEGSVWSTAQQCTVENSSEVVPIGKPIANVRLYVLGEELRVLPLGVRGELYVGGAGVTRGYLNDATLTALKYVPDPFSGEHGSRLYRTGDVGRYQSGGELEFVGRVDGQVKLRGYRVEVGEIEAVLGGHERVAGAVVVVRAGERGEAQLVGYVVAAPGAEVSGAELRQWLGERLPEYMVPWRVVVLAGWPLQPNGKVDRQRLPEPELVGREGERQGARTEIEAVVQSIWEEVLGVKELSVTDNFFELGGHSLLATQVMSRVREALQVELPVRSLFAQPTVRGLAGELEMQLQAVQGLSVPPIRSGLRDGELPLSYAQQRLWFADQLAGGSALYNVAAAVRLTGPLNVAALERTLKEIVRRHEVLRTSFPARQGEPQQVIAAQMEFALELTDLSTLPDTAREETARRMAAEEAQTPFDLAVGPLVRARLLRLSEAEHVVLFTMHHIVSDGWSMGLLIQEVSQLYEAYSAGGASPLAELPVQYADYAWWQRQWLTGEVLEKQLAYWREQLAGAPQTLALPTDKPRPAVQSFRGGQQRFELAAELREQLKELSRQESSSLFMTLLAAFKALLHFYSQQTDIVVGVDIANRHHIEVERLIGFFINILLMRTDFSGNPTFRELLKMVRETTLAAYAHQDLPFERLVEDLQPERSLSGMPMVQTMFSFHNAPKTELKLSNLSLSPFQTSGYSAKRDLTLFMMETEQGLVGTWNYNSNLFNASTIQQLSSQFELLLNKAVTEPDGRLGDLLEILGEVKRKQAAMDKKERRDSKLSQFMNIVPQAVNLAQVSLTKTGYLAAEQPTPLVIQPALDDVDLIDWARTHRQSIETQLLEHGAVLFRGFNIQSPSEFEQFALRICPELFGEYGDLPREGVSGKVYGSTPYPSDQDILFHNESSHLQRWPMKIWFFCMQPAQQGGETPIVDCRKIYEALDPKLRQRFAEKKLMYVRNYVDGLDVSWQEFFHTTDRSVVEEHCRKASIAFEWKNNGEILSIRQVCDAVLTHPKTGDAVFFNQLQAHHVSCLEPATRASLLSLLKNEDLPRNVYYGDGIPIEDSVVDEIREIYRQLAINFPWQKGDILMLDNMLTAHGRNAFVGERKIVVAMGEMITNQNVHFNGNGNRNAASNDGRF
jgi:amino acid adenylation domain-containing protein